MIRKQKLAGLATLAMVLLSLLPQIHLWLVRGREWNGAYVQIQGDEPLYAAYLNSLLHGRARRNDPYGGVDGRPDTSVPESTFSIQFIPAYVITFFARLFGTSASTAMIGLLGVGALLASIAVCWLLKSVTDDRGLAAAGTLFVLCLGGLAGGHALLGVFVYKKDISVPILPFQALSTCRFLPVANPVHRTGLARAGCADKEAGDDRGNARRCHFRLARPVLSLSLDRGGSMAGVHQRPLALVSPRR